VEENQKTFKDSLVELSILVREPDDKWRRIKMATQTILDEANKSMLPKGIGRRRLLSWAVGGGAALAGIILGEGVTADVAETSGEGALTFEVAPDLSTFDAMREPAGEDPFPTGPFHLQGRIFPQGTLNPDGTIPEGATSIGIFRCWGWIFDGSTGTAVVSQAFDIDGRGEIQVQGVEDLSRAVIGGTGEFSNVRGEGNFEFINPDNFSFRVTFRFWQQALVPLVMRNYAGQ
jgi:hypothetical protein